MARRRRWQCTNLGIAGQCDLDSIVAGTIAHTPSELVSLCLGVNIHGQASFSRRTLRGGVAMFIATIRDGLPYTPDRRDHTAGRPEL